MASKEKKNTNWEKCKNKDFLYKHRFLKFQQYNIIAIFEHWLLEIPTLLIFSFLIKFTHKFFLIMKTTRINYRNSKYIKCSVFFLLKYINKSYQKLIAYWNFKIILYKNMENKSF